MSFNKDFKIVEGWLASRGWHVYSYTDATDATYWHLKQIHIDSRKHSEKRLYTLLHECGHVLVDDNRDRIHSLSRNAHTDAPQRASREKRIAILSEEYEAWKRGERLAKRLDIKINTKKFDAHRATCLMSYTNWASDFYTHALSAGLLDDI